MWILCPSTKRTCTLCCQDTWDYDFTAVNESRAQAIITPDSSQQALPKVFLDLSGSTELWDTPPAWLSPMREGQLAVFASEVGSTAGEFLFSAVLWAKLELSVGRGREKVGEHAFGRNQSLDFPFLSSHCALFLCVFFDSIYFNFFLLCFSFLTAASLHPF